jgi:alkaline phosphatase
LDEATSRLFVDAFAVFGSMGASVRLDKSDPNNQVLVVERGRVRAEIPLSKSTMRLGGRVVSTGGLSVLSPITGKVYVPQRAVEVFKAAM